METHNTVMVDDDGPDLIYRALIAGRLSAEDLSARKLGSFLGRTTGAVYHRFGSLDGLLFAVSQRGFADLGARVTDVWSRKHSLAACAVAFVEFGLDHPSLYALMFEHRFDWAALRAIGAFEQATPGSQLLAGVVCLFEESGSKTALRDTRLLMAGLHGIVSFAASGRMNTGELQSPDRSIAIASAKDLATRLFTTPTPATNKQTSKTRVRQ